MIFWAPHPPDYLFAGLIFVLTWRLIKPFTQSKVLYMVGLETAFDLFTSFVLEQLFLTEV